jgi:hypothetical protein
MASGTLYKELGRIPDMLLAGISSSERIYRLCWAFNNNLTVSFSKIDDYEVILQKEEGPAFFPLYLHENPDQERMIYLIANKSNGKMLLPEWALADYLLVFQGAYEKQQVDELLADIRGMNWIQTCFPIEKKRVRSIKNLVL